MKDNFSADCNDEGIQFVDAQAKVNLNEFLKQPNLSLIRKFFPAQSNNKSGDITGDYVAKLQVTIFSCGGLAICACNSHKFGDGITFSLFLKSWAAIACKNFEELICPNYEAASLFPPTDEYPREATWSAQFNQFLQTGRFVTRRFVFDAKTIANLKAKAANSYLQNPTRVEVVSALLFKCLMAAATIKSGFHRSILLTHLVNLRRKANPQISESCVGNILWRANALCTEKEEELVAILCRLREAITKLDGDFVKNFQGEEGFLNLCKCIKDEGEVCSKVKKGFLTFVCIKDEGEVCSIATNRITFSSWCNFGFCTIDFGWEKPKWVSYVGSDESVTTFINLIILIDTKLGDGIEAWVLSLEEDMALLELDKELLAFATLDPSPLG